MAEGGCSASKTPDFEHQPFWGPFAKNPFDLRKCDRVDAHTAWTELITSRYKRGRKFD